MLLNTVGSLSLWVCSNVLPCDVRDVGSCVADIQRYKQRHHKDLVNRSLTLLMQYLYLLSHIVSFNCQGKEPVIGQPLTDLNCLLTFEASESCWMQPLLWKYRTVEYIKELSNDRHGPQGLLFAWLFTLIWRIGCSLQLLNAHYLCHSVIFL